MPEWVVPVFSMTLTLGCGWTVWHIIMAYLTMCEDVAAIKKEICGE